MKTIMKCTLFFSDDCSFSDDMYGNHKFMRRTASLLKFGSHSVRIIPSEPILMTKLKDHMS